MDKTMKRCQAFLAGVLLAVGVIFALSMCSEAKAQVVSVKSGDIILVQQAHFCESKDSAVEVAKMDEAQGIETAKKLLMHKADCGMGEGRLKVVKSAFNVKTPRGTTLHVLEVETKIGEHTITIYFLFEGTVVETSA